MGMDSHINALRHYWATELINAGVDVRTVAGRFGHGGTTALRVYAAWLSGSDQRAAGTLAACMPPRPVAPTQRTAECSPHRVIAAELRERMATGTTAWRSAPCDCRTGGGAWRLRRHSSPGYGPLGSSRAVDERDPRSPSGRSVCASCGLGPTCAAFRAAARRATPRRTAGPERSEGGRSASARPLA
ncbi:tyrosine-type recombinase/integrase [Micromonospora arida]